jgi:hypothetical protein
MAMNQILNLIDTEEVEGEALELSSEPVPIEQQETYHQGNHKP